MKPMITTAAHPSPGETLTTNRLVTSAIAAMALALLQFAAIRYSLSAIALRVVLPATIAAAPLALWPHRRHAGIWVIFVGLAANLAVVLANGGLMPI